MAIVRRRPYLLLFSLVLVAAGVFWATTSQAARPQIASLPSSTETIACPVLTDPNKTVEIEGLGTFTPVHLGEPPTIVARTGEPFISANGLKTVPIHILANGGKSFAEGIGETNFWLDTTRPLTSAIWEKKAGTEFPAVQEMRFHFFYTVESMPGKVFRSINPAIMRSNNVRAFPPLPGTVYRLVKAVEFEDIANPGVVVGRILSNRAIIPDHQGLRPEVLRRGADEG